MAPGELAPFVGAGNPATFISSVTFGRIFYLLIESTESADSIGVSVNLSFSGALGKVNDTTTVRYVNTLKDLHITAYALGGDANKALRAVTSSLDSLKDFLAEGGDIRTGVPISYVVRSVQHPEKIVKIGLNTTYDVRDCRPIFETFGNPILWLQGDDPNLVVDGSGRLTRWPDRSGMDNDAYLDRVVPAAQQPLLVAKAVNGEMPAVVFGDSTWLRFVGSGFANTDYTVAMVASFMLESRFRLRVPRVARPSNRVACCRPGSCPARIRSLSHMCSDSTTTGMGVGTDRVPWPEQYHLYTLVFSRTKGMSIYIDGQLASWNPAATTALQDFLGRPARQCAGDPECLRVRSAEFMAFATALSGEQRWYLEDNLMRKYKF